MVGDAVAFDALVASAAPRLAELAGDALVTATDILLLATVVRAALERAEKKRINKEGQLVVTSTATRSQADNVDDALALIARASKAGYNGVVLADYKFNILERMPPKYFKNVARVKDAATAAGV